MEVGRARRFVPAKLFWVLLHVISASSLPGVYQEHIAVCSNIQPMEKNRLPVAV